MVKVSICIDVPDLSAAAAFYCDALGCSVQKLQASHSTLSAGGVTMQLLLKEAGTAATVDGGLRSYERHWTPVHLDFDDDLDSAMALVRRGGGTVESVQRGDWGGMAICADPFGNGFCLVSIQT